jgi:hypothetical protein
MRIGEPDPFIDPFIGPLALPHPIIRPLSVGAPGFGPWPVWTSAFGQTHLGSPTKKSARGRLDLHSGAGAVLFAMACERCSTMRGVSLFPWGEAGISHLVLARVRSSLCNPDQTANPEALFCSHPSH